MSRLATIIICLLISLLLVSFLLWPEIQKYRNLNLSVKIKDIQIENQDKYFSQIQDKAERLKSYEEEISKIDSALPDDPGVPSVLEFVVQTANKNGMQLTEIVNTSLVSAQEATGNQTIQESGVTNNKLKEASIEFKILGEYSALKNFIATLEKNARLIEVESINFASAGTEKGVLPSFLIKIKTHSF